MRHLRTLALTGTLALATSLAPATASAQAQTAAPAAVQQQPTEQPRAARTPRPRRDVITSDELMASGTTNLYDAVQRLRPQWLRGAAASNFSGGGQGYVVYQDNAPMGGLEALRQTSIEFAGELRYLDGPTASNTLPGLGSRRVSGAIIIARPRN